MNDTDINVFNVTIGEVTLEKKEKRILLIVYIISSLIAFAIIAIIFNSVSPMTFVGYVGCTIFGLLMGGCFTLLFFVIFIFPKAVERLKETRKKEQLEKKRKAEETKYNEYNKYSDCCPVPHSAICYGNTVVCIKN